MIDLIVGDKVLLSQTRQEEKGTGPLSLQDGYDPLPFGFKRLLQYRGPFHCASIQHAVNTRAILCYNWKSFVPDEKGGGMVINRKSMLVVVPDQMHAYLLPNRVFESDSKKKELFDFMTDQLRKAGKLKN